MVPIGAVEARALGGIIGAAALAVTGDASCSSVALGTVEGSINGALVGGTLDLCITLINVGNL
ncbi:hypothetical protein [Bartonella sp. MM73XJBT.G]|uniref:hypothetical protein n=1 Tax=Bartonella sp. MM73XJBT.G TaxID=3019097 RepID=UPI00236174F9|nr:hypothetical protein [Bartonella sp. MM73XJBT.G]